MIFICPQCRSNACGPLRCRFSMKEHCKTEQDTQGGARMPEKYAHDYINAAAQEVFCGEAGTGGSVPARTKGTQSATRLGRPEFTAPAPAAPLCTYTHQPCNCSGNCTLLEVA